MTIYRVVLSHGTQFDLYYDASNPAANISARFGDADDEDSWQHTPHQAAEVSSAREAAQLVVDYFPDQPDFFIDEDTGYFLIDPATGNCIVDPAFEQQTILSVKYKGVE